MRGLLSSLFTLIVSFICLIPSAWADDQDIGQAVKAYREGRFPEAHAAFSALHAARPEDTKITYYLAMTEAQLGRFQQARALYESVVLLDPNSEVGRLAAQGLQYLPADAAVDPPPRFQAPPSAAQASGSPALLPQTGGTLPNGMTAQEMMTLQMMMSGLGGGQSGFNPMLMMGGGGTGNLDPTVMSNFLMNQMMQDFNFNLGGNPDENR